MVGRLFPGAHVFVDGRAGELIGGWRREQDVVDADAVVLLPGAGLVVPERVEALAIITRAYRVRKTHVAEHTKSFAGARQEQCVAGPGFRPAGVRSGRDDVV